MEVTMFSSLLLNVLPFPRRLQFLGDNLAWWYYYNWLKYLLRKALHYHDTRSMELVSLDFKLREDQLRPR